MQTVLFKQQVVGLHEVRLVYEASLQGVWFRLAIPK
jgi:hypothetical protein